MKNEDKQQWMNKNLRLNKDRQLKLGDRVTDSNGYKGVIVKIVIYAKDSDHEGVIYVWQEDRMEYGSDNCEHYCLENWHGFLRVLE